MATSNDADREEIGHLIERINEAWLNGRAEELSELFHPDMVMALHGFVSRAVGRDVCVESYKDFTRHATVKKFKPTAAEVDVWGDTAVAYYSWDIEFTVKGKNRSETGHDLFVFRKGEGGWRAVWRTLIPQNEAPG
jgi:uncharacterized protein (TIGR02246 family)